MSCCGGKRKAWTDQVKSVQSSLERMDLPRVDKKEKLERVFEYVGDRSLKVVGTSGQEYHFRFKGERLNILYYDAFALMAERDLKLKAES